MSFFIDLHVFIITFHIFHILELTALYAIVP